MKISFPKWLQISSLLCLTSLLFSIQAADLAEQLQKGLYEEEANHDLSAAIDHYQSIIKSTDQQRRIAATALFHLAECYRKLGKTNDAQTLYQRLQRDYSDQAPQLGIPGFAKSTADGNEGYASRTNEYARLMRLLDNSPDLINAPNRTNNHSYLQEAAATGDVDLIKLLLSHGAIVDKPLDETPLYLAASGGHKKAAEVLIKAGADVNARNKSSATPLHIAALRGYTEVSELLIDNGADLEMREQMISNSEDGTPLQDAVGNNNLEEIRLLLKRGAKIDATNSLGNSALIRALVAKQYAAARLLIASNANVNIQNNLGVTPLQLAAMNGYPDICKELLEHGAGPNVTDRLGETALMQAVKGPKIYSDTCNVLLEHGADPDITNRIGATALMMAANAGSHTTCKLLLESKADPNLQDQQGRTVLNQLVTHFKTRPESRDQFLSIAKLVLEHGADPNIEDHLGRTPLDYAVDLNNNYFASYPRSLASYPRTINGLPGDGTGDVSNEPDTRLINLLLTHGGKAESAIWFALDTPNILKLLLEVKANPNVKNEKGNTPLDYYYRRNNNPIAPNWQETRDLLIQYGGTNTIASPTNSPTPSLPGVRHRIPSQPISSEGGNYQSLPNQPLLPGVRHRIPSQPISSEGGNYQWLPNQPLQNNNIPIPTFQERLNEIVRTNPGSGEFKQRLNTIVGNASSNTVTTNFQQRLDQILTNAPAASTNSSK